MNTAINSMEFFTSSATRPNQLYNLQLPQNSYSVSKQNNLPSGIFRCVVRSTKIAISVEHVASIHRVEYDKQEISVKADHKSSETSVERTTTRYISEEKIIHNRRCENLSYPQHYMEVRRYSHDPATLPRRNSPQQEAG